MRRTSTTALSPECAARCIRVTPTGPSARSARLPSSIDVMVFERLRHPSRSSRGSQAQPRQVSTCRLRTQSRSLGADRDAFHFNPQPAQRDHEIERKQSNQDKSANRQHVGTLGGLV